MEILVKGTVSPSAEPPEVDAEPLTDTNVLILVYKLSTANALPAASTIPRIRSIEINFLILIPPYDTLCPYIQLQPENP